MLKIKEYKGITLIALVISIIVLLILAGVTINAISGSDSAPAKANEAGQKNDIGAAKDDISLTATNAKLQGMEAAYVSNGVSAGDASTTVGTEVIKAVAQKYQTNNQVGKATIEIEDFGTIENVTANATVSVYTTDFIIEGTITLEDGILTWGEIVPNVPGIKIINVPATLDKNDSATLSIKRKNVSGNVTWTSDTTAVATVNENTGEVTGVTVGTATITASVTENETIYTAECTITVVLPEQVIGQYVDLGTNLLGLGTTKDWRILTKDSTGTWVILADYLPYEKIPEDALSNTRLKRVNTTTYNVNADSSDYLITGLTEGWSSLTDKGTVYGAVTGEKLIESYNKKYGTIYELASSPTLDNTDTLFVPHSSELDGCNGYWLRTDVGGWRSLECTHEWSNKLLWSRIYEL